MAARCEAGRRNSNAGRVARLALPFALLAGTTLQADPLLEDARWQHRLLVITAPSADDPALREQRERLAGWDDDAAARDLLRVELVAGGAHVSPPAVSPPVDAAALRASLALDRERFGVVLVGLDGGVKLRSDKPLRRCALLAVIDAMPMRRRELAADAGLPACVD